MDSAKSVLLLVSGPAGSGKTTLCDRLRGTYPDIQRVITATTRSPRTGEVDGQDYFFLTDKSFKDKIAQEAFYEHALVHGKHYGVLKEEIDSRLDAGVDLLLNIDVQGAESFRNATKHNPELARRMVSVFILPQSISQLSERLFDRDSDDKEEIERRLIVAEKEMREADQFDHRILSGTRDEDFAALQKIYFDKKGLAS
ncbi:guanylate kinase [Rubellicoccus peritrichatus]|uniref:Guanylate kinase n=1 Tax=Rubellicoccus peritrichatus TaxID=3080537 RepID=A0AAQ3LD06_9BACT|nr:guanylate kinase [Puniceicoccus sp. CR14]WOO43226.1 guanylate kinase [Puniceicoccus sp. CR14]